MADGIKEARNNAEPLSECRCHQQAGVAHEPGLIERHSHRIDGRWADGIVRQVVHHMSEPPDRAPTAHTVVTKALLRRTFKRQGRTEPRASRGESRIRHRRIATYDGGPG